MKTIRSTNLNVELTEYVCCPICKSDLLKSDNYLLCEICHQKYKLKSGIPHMISDVSKDLKLTSQKWDKIYDKQLKDKTYKNDYQGYMKFYYQDTYRQLEAPKKINNLVYLEIGCGPFFLGQEIAKSCKLIVGIDISSSALKMAKKMLDDKGIKNYLLVQGDILNMPLKNNIVDLIYGGCVIGHFNETQTSVDELYRILKKNGVSFNTFPYLNIGSLTYRQLWGNIPNFPIVKQIAEFIHIKLLKGKHMIFGFEMSFLATTLKKVHRKAGFSNVSVEKFDVQLLFEFLPEFAKRPAKWLAMHSRLFWPMVKVIAKK